MTETYAVPRKVLMTADAAGEVWTYSLELARGLGERGVEVALATLGGPLNDLQRNQAERIPGLRVFEACSKPEWLLNLENRICPDVIHLNDSAHAALPWSAPAVVVGHSCVLSRWQALHQEPSPEDLERVRTEAAAGFGAASLVVAPSAAMLTALAAHYGPLPATRVIPHGRDAHLFRPTAKEPMIFSTGPVWDEAKNLAALEQAAPQLAWPVFVSGESKHPDGGEIRHHHTRQLGRLTQRALAAWLGRSAIYALPARYEPFGLSVLEAALAGCALVLGDIPNLRETWRNRAVFVPPDDPQALQEALAALIQEPDRRQSLAAAAHKRALEYTPEKMVDGYLQAYAQVLAESEAPFPVETAYPQQVAV
jgi:glycosyltransferase involved in cell wall biosynthesis